jgi:hypothetical protein
MNESAKAAAGCDASVVRGAGHNEQARAHGRYEIECIGPDGQVKWRDTAENVVTTEGKNSALDVYLDAATQITSWFIGLISSVSYTAVAAGDTAAQIDGTNGWKEAGALAANNPDYSQGTRPAATFGEPSSGSLSTSSASAFSITETGTVKGCFLISNSTKGGTTGVLYSAGLFTGGDKAVANGDTLNVSYTASL